MTRVRPLTIAALPPLAWLAAALATASPAQAQDPQLARSLAATCANCHGTNGHARGDMRPLAGMAAERIVAAMTDFKSGAVPGTTVMHQIAKGYTDAQIQAIAGFFAAQKPAAR